MECNEQKNKVFSIEGFQNLIRLLYFAIFFGRVVCCDWVVGRAIQNMPMCALYYI